MGPNNGEMQSARKRKSGGGRIRSSSNELGTPISPAANGNTDEIYYATDALDEEEEEELGGKDGGPGGEFVTYPAAAADDEEALVNEPEFSNEHETRFDSEDDDVVDYDDDYSREYQFAVGCPDEEMHGRAVALFDFTREHENELPLCEGQVVYVSYRQSHGWLVAEDPKTGESGLVPEEFVRLLRDIEGGLSSLNSGGGDIAGGDEYLMNQREGEDDVRLDSIGAEPPLTTAATTTTKNDSKYYDHHLPPADVSGENHGHTTSPVIINPTQASSSSQDVKPDTGSPQ